MNNQKLESGHQPKYYAAGTDVQLDLAAPYLAPSACKFVYTLTAGTVLGVDEYGNEVTFGGVEFPAFTFIPVCLTRLRPSGAAVYVAW